MNIKAYIKTKSASSIQEIIPPTGFINIKVVDDTIRVRDRQLTENWTNTNSNTLLFNSIGNYRVIFETNSMVAPYAEIYYVSCTSAGGTKYVIYVSTLPFTVVEGDWRGSSTKWNITGELFEDTGLYIAYSDMQRFTSWQTGCTPKDYGTGAPRQFMRQIANDFLGE